ncbi:MAG TPA: sugar transferase [Gemmatimonadales bacterium]|jgi:lipopolysaccharide/colanic/teichoic acid biosynthesis glycosyltransferase|nr:sugar transferase [Gemmatimonadales bacterium]
MTSVRYAAKPLRGPSRGLAGTITAEQAEGLRRALNVTVAAVGLVLSAPLMAAIALAIKLTSRGPIFYTQTRVGIDRRAQGVPPGNTRRRQDSGGKPFRIFKFRTMAMPQRATDAGEVWARPDDPRVTPLGRILRLYRLDELPQLINVLRGDMNVVGPRPEQPTIFLRLRAQIERYQERQRVRPGITGWAQVNQQYDRSLDDVRRKVQLDLEYIARVSVREDLQIMLRTLPVVVGKQGAW